MRSKHFSVRGHAREITSLSRGIKAIRQQYKILMIGGGAVEFYTLGKRVRSIEDTDFCVVSEAKNMVKSSMMTNGFRLRSELDDEHFLFFFLMGKFEVDIMGRDTDMLLMDFDEPSLVEFEVDGLSFEFPMISLTDLLIDKMVASITSHRAKDREDLVHLTAKLSRQEKDKLLEQIKEKLEHPKSHFFYHMTQPALAAGYASHVMDRLLVN